MMNGTFWYCGCWRIHCSSSSPDISGISQSHNTRSKLVLDIRDWARRPFWASVVSMTGKRWRTVRFTRSLTKLASSTTSAFSVAITTSAPDSTHAPTIEHPGLDVTGVLQKDDKTGVRQEDSQPKKHAAL